MVLRLEAMAMAIRSIKVSRVSPVKNRLNAGGGVVGKGQAHAAGGCNRQQVAVAQTVLANGGPQGR